jgi:hypothetical protein
VVDFYRRLETLVSYSIPSANECRSLAEEATQYLRQNRLNGIFDGPVLADYYVGHLASRLGIILTNLEKPNGA